jgi:aminomethyltransferase
MPIPTPFHPRTSALCTSLSWKEWAGYHAVRHYDTCHEPEYFAIRHAAGLIDVSPLFKYEIRGPDAATLLARLTVRDICRLKPGRVTYLCWCNDDGKVIDDGTVARFDEEAFRLTANSPSLSWLLRHARRYRVSVEESSRRLGALALQGPNSRAILEAASGSDLGRLRFFRLTRARIAGVEVEISRTGYTGDLGYEIWVATDRALAVWDALVVAGRDFRLEPAGLDAMDVTRVEAGFILHGVDYFSAPRCMVESRKSSPYEIGLGWTVRLDREPFVVQAALRGERAAPARWAHAGLVLDWDDFEALHDEFDLPPQVPATAWRDGVPVFDLEGRQVGQATSGAWSPILKKNLALATVEARCGALGTRLQIEVTVEYQRRRVGAAVVRTPFFDPPRKRA